MKRSIPPLPSYVNHLVPLAGDSELDRGLARQAARRMKGVLATWRRIARGPARRCFSRVARLATAVLGSRDPAARAFLGRGEVRGWIAGCEDALDVAGAALRAARAPRREGRFPASWSRLVDLVADLGELRAAAPRGRVDSAFPARALRVALSHLERQAEDLPLVALAALPPGKRKGRYRIRFAADPALGRTRAELPVAGTGETLARAPGTPRTLDLVLGPDVIRAGGRPRPYPSLRAAFSVPRVGAVVASEGLVLRILGRDRRFEARVSEALDLLERAWPEAATMIRARTHLVVPVLEWGTVSYSSPRRPGVTYVHVESRPLVCLAEDLLHEAAHQRLHEMESFHPLVAPPRGGEEPRVYSPWRREWRPVRGLLHGAWTFTVGGRFFERMLRAAEEGVLGRRIGPARRLWLARRLLEEMESVRVALAALRRADRQGLLLPGGRAVVKAIASERRRLRAAAREAARRLRAAPGGGVELKRLGAHLRMLEEKPVRWSFPLSS